MQRQQLGYDLQGAAQLHSVSAASGRAQREAAGLGEAPGAGSAMRSVVSPPLLPLHPARGERPSVN